MPRRSLSCSSLAGRPAGLDGALARPLPELGPREKTARSLQVGAGGRRGRGVPGGRTPHTPTHPPTHLPQVPAPRRSSHDGADLWLARGSRRGSAEALPPSGLWASASASRLPPFELTAFEREPRALRRPPATRTQPCAHARDTASSGYVTLRSSDSLGSAA